MTDVVAAGNVPHPIARMQLARYAMNSAISAKQPPIKLPQSVRSLYHVRSSGSPKFIWFLADCFLRLLRIRVAVSKPHKPIGHKLRIL